MLDNEIKQPEYFQPSKATIETWLFTRKDKHRGIGGRNLPGFLTTSGEAVDAFLALFGLIIEFGVFFLYISFADTSNSFNIITPCVIIFLDLVFIAFVHCNKKANVKLENALKFVDIEDVNPLLQEKTDNKTFIRNKLNINLRNTFSRIGIVLELLACIFKILGFFSVYQRTDILMIGVVFAYFLQTFCYINSMGYFISFVRTYFALRRDFNAFELGNGKSSEIDKYKAKIRFRKFSSSIEYETTNKEGIRGFPQFSLERDNVENTSLYILSFKGIPTDADIIAFAGAVKHNGSGKKANEDLLGECHALQLEVYAQIS